MDCLVAILCILFYYAYRLICKALHIRRKFEHAKDSDDEKQANYVLDEMQLLYALEQRMREQEMDWEQRTEERNTHVRFWNDWRNGSKRTNTSIGSRVRWEKPLTTHCPDGRD